MTKKLILSLHTAMANIRANLLQTTLSILGIVIGVAALVAILSLIDGLEKYANEQISQTTGLEMVIIEPVPYEQVNDVWVRKDSFKFFDYGNFKALYPQVQDLGHAHLLASSPTRIALSQADQEVGAHLTGISEFTSPEYKIAHGRALEEEDLKQKNEVAVVSQNLAETLKTGTSPGALLGQKISIETQEYEVVGIIDEEIKGAVCFVPITLFDQEKLANDPPKVAMKASKIELVPILKNKTEEWLKLNYKDHDHNFRVVTNEYRVSQANQGFLIFRLVMGLIVGISVLVGGIGVMNVLLIAVTERTREIGIRKALGAKKSDILVQFLAESIAISGFGSAIGLVVGILGSMAFTPLVKSITNAPFQAAYTFNTLVIISIVALFVGIIFGTYPALRASRLNPVDAIRSE